MSGRACHRGSAALIVLLIAGCGMTPGTGDVTPTLGGEFLPGDGGDGPRGDGVVEPAGAVDSAGVLSFLAEPAYCCDPFSMTFTAELPPAAKSEGAVFNWDFGDRRTATGTTATHTYSWPGDYRVRLTAALADGSTLESEQTVSFTGDALPDGSDPPTDDPDDPTVASDAEVHADAGLDLLVRSGAITVLDGRSSSGTGDQALRFEWRQLHGPAVTLENRFSIAASFAAPVVDSDPVTLTFALIVTQGDVTDVDDLNVVVSLPEPTVPIPPPVRFALTDENGVFIPVTQVDGSDAAAQPQRFVGDWGTAEIHTVDNVQFELVLNARRNLRSVWFPWFPDEYACDRILYPHLLGLEIDNHRLAPRTWSNDDIAVYPGQTVFPGAVMESAAVGLGVFATNWPPLELRVLYARGQVTLRYDESVRAGQTRRYRAMIVDAAGDVGVEPWHRAVEPYKNWLRSNMQADGLLPIAYPAWLLAAHGWSNVQLQDYDDPVGEARFRWETWGDVFPAIQTWGSMSDRHYEGLEGTGCCLIDTSLHPRNADLPSLAQAVIFGGGQFGYYARPQNTGPVAGTSPAADENRKFLLDWIDVNLHQLDGNLNYLDWFIARPLGPTIDVARQFRDGLWGYDTVCERAVDVFPTAFLMSGALWGGPRFNTLAEQTLGQMPAGQTGIAFPRLVRYVLDDRVVFLGESNGDHVMWGTRHGGDFWGERQAFLLGCKLDWMQRPDGSGPDDPAVPVMVEAWKRSGFWARSPVYRDTMGLTNLPAGAEVKRFRGAANETILAVVTDRPGRALSLTVDGQLRTIVPQTWFDIIILDN